MNEKDYYEKLDKLIRITEKIVDICQDLCNDAYAATRRLDDMEQGNNDSSKCTEAYSSRHFSAIKDMQADIIKLRKNEEV